MAGRSPSPLELKRYYVLLALAASPLHPYGIYQQIAEDSHQTLLINLTTLHRILQTFVNQKLIQIIGIHEAGSTDIFVYAISHAARKKLRFAAYELAAAATTAQKRL